MPSPTLDPTTPPRPHAENDGIVQPPRESSLDSSLPPLRAGDVVADRYRVEQVLGCGAMAWVLSATHVQRNATVALQFLRFRSTREAVARFFPVGRTAAQVSSEAAPRTLEVDWLGDGTPFLVMQHLEGFELQKLIDEPGWLPVITAVDFGIQACEGLAVVHGARIADRDVAPAGKPASPKRTDSMGAKRIDFGVSKLAAARSFKADEERGDAQVVSRSPVYAAPELLRSNERAPKQLEPRADVWSLGVLLYELLSGGSSPFEAPTPTEVCNRILADTPDALSSVRPDLPLGLETVVYRCLERDPSRRFADGQSLAIALAPYASRCGQLRARHMQHSRVQVVDDAPFNPRRSLPPMHPPPRPSSGPPQPRGPTGTVRLVAASATQAKGKPPVHVFAAGIAFALLLLGGLVITAILAVHAVKPTTHAQAITLTAGVPNHMPEEAPAPPVSLSPLPVEAPIDSERVYTPEELPPAGQGSAAAPTPRDALPAGGPETRRSGKSAGRVGPDGF
jgi:serine/threonine-protein kinase